MNRAGFGWAALALVVVTVYGALLPFNYRWHSFDAAWAAFADIGYLDFASAGGRGDWVITALQYAALGFVLTGVLSADRPRWVGVLAACVTIPAGAGLCVALEFAQQYFPPRTVSLNDVILGCGGVVAGALAWLAVGRRVTAWARRFLGVTGLSELAARALPGYLVVLFVAELMPFDFATTAGELGAKWAEGMVRLSLLSPLSSPAGLTKAVLNFTWFVPVGFLHAFARRRGRVGGLVFAVPLAVEGLQLLTISRICDIADLATGLAGVWAGRRVALAGTPALFARRIEAAAAWFRAAQPLLTLAWAGAVLLLYWWPLNFVADPAGLPPADPDSPPLTGGRVEWVPFVDYYWGSKYNALDQFAYKTLSFLPLGVIAGLGLVNLYRRWVAGRVVAVAAAVAVLIAAGRYYLPGHAASVSDVLMMCGGAWFGFAATRYLRAISWAELALHAWRPPAPSPVPGLRFIDPVGERTGQPLFGRGGFV